MPVSASSFRPPSSPSPAPHVFRCAAAIFLRAAALIVRFLLTGFDGVDFALTAGVAKAAKDAKDAILPIKTK